MKLPSISCCMIVRDEEQNLPRALASVMPLVDELVVVDTGSVDSTIEIAERFGARVFHHPWVGDFAFHRNQAMSYAVNDWLFILDADEEIEMHFPVTGIKRLLADLDPEINAVAFLVQDIRQGQKKCEWKQQRFFRRGKGKYQGKIHNQPVVEGKTALMDFLTVKHYGYAASEQRETRINQSLEMLLSETENNPMSWFYLGELYGMRGQVQESADAFEKYWATRDVVKEIFPGVFYAACRNYMALNQMEKAREWIERGLQILPDDPDMAFALLDYGVLTGNENAIQNGARLYWNAFNKYRESIAAVKGFTFTLNNECFGLALYRLAILSIKQWKDAWDELRRLWPKVEQSARENIREYAAADLKRIGIDGLELPLDVEAQPASQKWYEPKADLTPFSPFEAQR